MKELLDRINDTFNKSLVNSSEETQLQIKILKNNINALFEEYGHDQPTQTTTQEAPDSLEQDDMKSILIIDDSSIIRNYLERIFINDYNVKMAVDGNDGIDKIKKDPKINIILLDLVMPKADGFVVLEYIEKNNIDVPVIIISGETSKDSINRAFEYNVVDVIKKPFDVDIIREKIDRYSK
jgi:putative two-component system response regulator